MDEIVNGSDILVSRNTGTTETPIWTPTAFSTSHKCTTSAETKQRVHKDLSNPLWPEKKVTGLSQTITTEALCATDESAEGYDQLLAAMKAAEPVQLKYAPKTTAIANGDKYEEGMFIITSLERNDPATEDSTMSATFESCGEIETKTYSAQEGS